mmetsp:Transcript_49600/g.101269  ORF Transcript_49600/g.101269 Transcript_49600/m.101269 type:complete len:393 (+) Transcript_49600:198-1376(+)
MAEEISQAPDLQDLESIGNVIPLTYTTRSGEILTTLKRLRPQPSFILSQAPDHPMAGIVVVGYSVSGRRNVRNIYDNPACMVRYIVEDEPERVALAEQDIKELGIENLQIVPYSKLPVALMAKEINFVIVSAPNEKRKEIVTNALTANKHVMCDKPLASSIEDAAELFALSRKMKKTLITILPGRPGKAFSPVIMALIASASNISLQRKPDADAPEPPSTPIDPNSTEVEEMLLNMAYHDAFSINFCMCMRPTQAKTTIVTSKPGTVQVELLYANECQATITCTLGQIDQENQNFTLTGDRLTEMRRVDHMNSFKEQQMSDESKGIQFTQVYDGATRDALEQMYAASAGRVELASRVRPGLMEQNVIDCLHIATAAISSIRNGGVTVPVKYW